MVHQITLEDGNQVFITHELENGQLVEVRLALDLFNHSYSTIFKSSDFRLKLYEPVPRVSVDPHSDNETSFRSVFVNSRHPRVSHTARVQYLIG